MGLARHFQAPSDFSSQLLDDWKRKTLAGALLNLGARFFCATKAPGSQLVQEGLLVFGFQGAGASALVLAFEQRIDPALDEGADKAEYGALPTSTASAISSAFRLCYATKRMTCKRLRSGELLKAR